MDELLVGDGEGVEIMDESLVGDGDGGVNRAEVLKVSLLNTPEKSFHGRR